MRRLTALVLAIFLIAVVALPAGASREDGRRTFVVELSGDNEVPAVETDGSGVATLTVNQAKTALNFTLKTRNLEEIHMAHIHCGPSGVNGPVVAFLFGPADPPVTQDGLLARGVITDESVIDRVGGLCPFDVTGFDDLLELIKTGNAYVNVHTMAFPAGEIRGQVG
jgi:hypothetical protein